MNKHLHRIVFNAARGLRMVVQESARSTGKGASGASSAAVSAAAVAAALMSSPLHAQIVADPGAPGRQRPTLLAAPNGVPLVNIQTPSAAGVSRNTYSQFDVDAKGVILNNSRTNAQTQLGGWVQGNPWLAGGGARVILNEVNSANPSQLRGYVEVAGPRAEVIIANPAGIQVNGGGFINASRATLTTGTPQFNANGGLDSFLVRGGTVAIEGAGLDASKTDYAAILARAVRLNAGLWANELKVVTGANQVAVDGSAQAPVAPTGTTPAFALDVAALGGMYAGKITLIGTEAGLGVRNAGHIGAGVGGLVVTAAGRLENIGTLEGAKVDLRSDSDIDNRGGTIRQAGTRDLAITAPVLSNTAGGFIGAEPVAVQPEAGAGDMGGSTSGGGSVTPTTGTATTSSPGGTVTAEAAPAQPAAATGPGAISGTGRLLNDGGRIYAGGEIGLDTPRIDNSGGTLSVGTLAVRGERFSNAGGTLNVARAFNADVRAFDNSGGKLNAGSLRIASTGDLRNTDGVLTSQGDASLGAGGDIDNTRGTVSAAGALDAKADGALTNSAGTLVAGGPVKVSAQSMDNSAGAVQSSKADLRLTVRNALQNTHGTMGAGTDLSVQAGSLANLGKGALRGTQDASVTVDGAAVNEGAITAGRHLTLAAQSLDSAKASVLGAGVQADGRLGSSGDMRLSTARQLAAHGYVVAAGKASLHGAGIDLADSRSHAGEMQITATQGDVVTQHAVVSATGLLQIDVRASASQRLRNDAGKLSAGQLVVGASNLSNTQAGEMVQTGAGTARIEVAGDVDNRGGSMGAIEDLDLRAGGAVTNNGGTIAANHALRLDAGTLDNTRGSVAAVKGALNLTTTGITTNTGGVMQAGQAVASTSNGLVNTEAGRVIGDSLTIDTRGQALDNRHGTFAATRTAVIDSGAFDNAAGLLQSGGAMAVDTHGQVLTNTDVAGYETKQGGITSAGTLTLATGAIDNSAGFIGAKEDFVAHTGAVVNGNGGLVLGQAALNIDTQGALYDNRGGKTQSIGAMRIDAGAIDNSGSLIRSIASATLNAVTITNADTQGDEQGIEAKNLVLGATTLNNTGGAIRADVDATVRSAGHVDNTGGLISAHNVLRIEDPAADIGARTLQLSNTGGTLVADQALQVEASSLVGNGKITSGKDLSLGFSQDLLNEGEISANGNLRYASAGNVSNNGKLLAGGTLAVSGRNVDNAEGAEMRGDTTIVNAADTVTNRGLIDGRDTQINAHAVVNAKTGRIYGDHVSIAADSVLNDGDGLQAGSIAARQRLDIGARTVLNREHALLFSGGELAIGGALDAERHATGKAELIHNASATIESLGDMELSAATIRNSNKHLKVERVPVSSVYKEALMPEGWTESRPASAFVIPDGKWIYLKVHPEKYGQRQEAPPAVVTTQNCYGGDAGGCDAPVTTTEPRNSARFSQFGVAPPTQAPEPTPAQFGCSFFLMACPAYEQAKAAWDASYSTALDQLGKAIDAYNAEVKEDNRLQQLARAWTELNYTESVSRDSAGTSSDPAKIFAGGNMTLSGQLINTDSQVLAGGVITTDQAPENYQTRGEEVLSRKGDSIYRYWTHHGGLDGGTKWGHKDTPYTPADSKTTFALPGWRYEENTHATEHEKPEASGKVLVGDRASDTGSSTEAGRGRTFTEVPANVTAPGGAAADGSGAVRGEGPRVVRTSTPDTRAPAASLFRTGNDGRYLVETDPRFAGYRNWLSSDYLFNALGLDPNSTLKRLGDGFYEQKLIREQIAQLTGYRYLEGFGNDEAQYTALMNAGATFAQQYGLRPGIALSAAQMAQLTSDIVWLVEQTVTLADGSSQRVLVPHVYVRVRPGDIDGSGALLSGSTLKVKGGEDDKGLGDLVNTGTIAGRQLVSIHADNVRNLGGRIVGDSVGIAARNDLDSIGGSIEARNAAVLTAGHDINIRSTTSTQTSAQGSRTNLDRVAGVYVTNPGGTLIASAGNDVNIVGAVLSNTGEGSYTKVHADRDVKLGTVQTSNSQDISWDAKNYRRSSESDEVGSRIIGGSGTGSSVIVDADRDIVARQAALETGGLLSVHADGNIDMQVGRSTRSVDDAHESTIRGTFSKKTLTSRTTADESISHGSSFGGNLTSITANGNITGEGVRIRGDEGVLVQAQGALDLHEARDLRSQSRETSEKRSGFGFSGGSLPAVVPQKNERRDNNASYSNTAAPTIIESKNGGVLLLGDQGAALRGVQIDAKKDVTVKGATVSVIDAVNEQSSSSTHYEKNLNLGTETWWRDPGTGINAKRTDTDAGQRTSLAGTSLNGANVNLLAVDKDGKKGTLTLGAITVNTPGKLTLEADQLVLATQTTKEDQSHTSAGRDLAWQKTQGKGSSDEQTHYAKLNAGELATPVNSVQAGLGARDSVEALAQQTGMGWVRQLNEDPKLQGKVDWVKVEEAHKQWDYKQQGLTPEGAAIVTLVAAYFAVGPASAAGSAAGDAAAVAAGQGVVIEGAVFAAGSGVGAVVGGAVTAGLSALASQVAVALINNRGDLGATLHELGSSANVKNLLTAIATGGVLGGLNLNPTGLPTVGGGTEQFITQLGQNIQGAAAKALIGTAINGGSLEDNLKNSLKAAFIDTLAAQAANVIGTHLEPGSAANLFAHAIAGCVAGAARTNGSCGAGALGAAVGELAARLYDPEAMNAQADTVQFAAMMGGIATATAGGSAADINLASQAAANAAANNWLATQQKAQMKREIDAAKTALEKLQVFGKWALISGKQDVLTANGIGKGLVDAGISDVQGLIDFLSSPIEGLKGLRQIINSPDVRQQLGDKVFAELDAQIERMQTAIAVGGDRNAEQLGQDLGSLVWHVGSVLMGVDAAAKGGVVLAKAGVNIGTNTLEGAALQFMKFDAGAIKGFKSADEVNALMNAADGWSPAWTSGSSVAEVTMKPGTTVKMVVTEAAYNDMQAGKLDRAFGGWATFDDVPNAAYAGNELAMTSALTGKSGSLYVVDVQIMRPINAQVGGVGAQGSAAGGGNQLHFLVPREDRAAVFQYVRGSGRAL